MIKIFLFFQNYLHLPPFRHFVQVIHRSEERRMVLVLDIHHPDLAEDRRRLWRQRLRVTSWGESGPPGFEVNYEEEAEVTGEAESAGREEL